MFVVVTLRIALTASTALTVLAALAAFLSSSCRLLQSECSEYPNSASEIAYCSDLNPVDRAASHWRDQRPTAAI